jgi:hypothetical protein
VDLAEAPRGDSGVGAVHSARRLAVADEVLRRRGDAAREPAPLEALHARRDEPGGELGVLAEGLVEASPAGVAAEVGHRGEGPVDAGGPGRSGGARGDGLDEGGVEARGEAEVVGEDRGSRDIIVAVDGVRAVDERDAQARAIEVEALKGVREFGPAPGRVGHRRGAPAREDRADVGLGKGDLEPALVDRPAVPLARAHEPGRVHLGHLADLLLEGHPPEEVSHPLGHGPGWVEVGRARLGEAGKGERADGESGDGWKGSHEGHWPPV